MILPLCVRCKPIRDDEDGRVCCGQCGKVLSEDFFSEEATFVKDAGGQSRLSGNLVNSILSGTLGSHERTLDKARFEIGGIVSALEISGGESITNQAFLLYKTAADWNFTRGRRIEQVAAVCVYIACRLAKDPKPFLLIDFSQFLGINVYVLGAVFLQLCKRIWLEKHPTILKPVDPSLYIHRYVDELLKKRNMTDFETTDRVEKKKKERKVCDTALKIIASMKKDWIQTGRKPSGVCGVAIYISTLAHGCKTSISDIVKVVHICEATLAKRLIEFENTDSGSLTIEELEKIAKEFPEPSKNVKGLEACKLLVDGSQTDGSQKSGKVLCEHKDKESHFHGLCEDCYKEFIKLFGGLHGGSDPPAFQRAERERMALASANKGGESSLFMPQQETDKFELVPEKFEKVKSFAESSPKTTKNERLDQRETDCTSATTDHIKKDGVSDAYQKSKDTSSITNDESDGLSDIDDVEVSGYLNNEKEMHYKKIIWEEMNKEYLQEQAAAAKLEASQENCSDELRSRKERKRKQVANASPAQTAAEGAHQMVVKKRLSSKVDYDALETLYANKPPSDQMKKLGETNGDGDGDGDANGQSVGEKEHDGDITDNYDEVAQEYEDMEQEDAMGIYSHGLYFENEEDGYGYDDGENEY